MSVDNEKDLADLTIRMRDEYRAAEAAVQELANRSHSDPEHLEHVADLLAIVKKTEAELRPQREAFQSTGRSLPEYLVPVVQETVEIVNRLIPSINQLEQIAVAAREKLRPQIHEGVRAASMQNAYSRATRTAT